jgi:hypothetical protein
MRLRKPRKALFAAAAVAGGVLVSCLALLALDVHLHHKFERGVLFNVWGYRGPVVGRKQPNEYRVAIFGGSTAFGFGVKWEESMPALLDQKLAARGAPIHVINLAYNGEGAYSFTFTMADYAYLNYDMVLFYEGYNDLFGDPDRPRHAVFRHESPVFRLTGYLPIFPIVAREKASVMLYGDTRAVYRDAHHAATVFRPGLATRTKAGILTAAASVGDSLERQLERVLSETAPPAQVSDGSTCSGTWAAYCRLLFVAVSDARARGKQVLVVTQPYLLGPAIRAAHEAQQRGVSEMLERRFDGDDSVRYLNLGDIVDVGDPELSFDRMHLTRLGNERVADALVHPVLELAASATHRVN